MAWANRFRRHCNDEQLVAFMDGELSRREAQSVQDHTTACYQCRARLKGLEEQALNVAQLLEKDAFPRGDNVSKAIDSFWQEQAQIQVEAQPIPVSRWSFSLGVRHAALATVALMLLIGASSYFVWNTDNRLDPEVILAKAESAEIPFGETGSHQVLRVVVNGGGKAEVRSTRRLEVWKDPATHRLSVELSDGEGRLERAIWRPDQEHEFRFDRESKLVSQARKPGDDASSVTVLDALMAESSDQNSFEDGIMRWITSRSRYPIMVARDFAAFARQKGVALTAVNVGGEKRIALLTAERRLSERVVRMTLEVDLETYWAGQGTIEFIGPGGPTVIQLLVERHDLVSPVEFVPAVFEPNPSLLRSQSASRRAHVGSESPRPAPVVPAVVGVADPLTVEMQVRLALHRVGACRGEPIEISRDEGGVVRIRGVAVIAEQLERWQMALAGLEMPESWIVDLQVLEMGTTVKQMPEVRASTVRAVRPPVEEHLLLHFQEREGLDPASAGRRATELTNRVLSVSQAALVEAWALRKLADRYSSSQELSEEERNLLNRMLRDHLETLGERSAQLLRWLGPVWPLDAEVASRTLSSDPWEEQALRLFGAVEDVHSGVLSIFTATELPAEGSGASSAELSAHLGPDLVRTLAALNRRTQLLGTDVENKLWADRQLQDVTNLESGVTDGRKPN